MRTPELNPEGYLNFNPLSGLKKLTGKLMLIHGMADDNVHVQHTLQYISALNEAQKPYLLYLYPESAHGISGKQNRLDAYTKMYMFILETLKQ
jgi:dipeptidyl-peptidase-4